MGHTPTAACVCGEINTRHCPVHGQGETTAASPPRYVSQAEAERMVETARAMVTAYDGMLAASFWIEYGALKSEIEEFERKWANVQP